VTYNVGIAPTMPALQASHDLSRVAIESGMHYITHVYNNNKVYKKVNLRLCAECGVLVGRIYGLSVENWCSSRDGYVCERWKGFHSIRINDQWRVIFRWEGGNALDAQVVDYH